MSLPKDETHPHCHGPQQRPIQLVTGSCEHLFTVMARHSGPSSGDGLYLEIVGRDQFFGCCARRHLDGRSPAAMTIEDGLNSACHFKHSASLSFSSASTPARTPTSSAKQCAGSDLNPAIFDVVFCPSAHSLNVLLQILIFQ